MAISNCFGWPRQGTFLTFKENREQLNENNPKPATTHSRDLYQ